MAFLEAEAYCSSLGSSLWTPNSREEIDALVTEMPLLNGKYFVTPDDEAGQNH